MWGSALQDPMKACEPLGPVSVAVGAPMRDGPAVAQCCSKRGVPAFFCLFFARTPCGGCCPHHHFREDEAEPDILLFALYLKNTNFCVALHSVALDPAGK